MTGSGGAFLVRQAPPGDAFTPEDLPADVRLMAETMTGFVRERVLPQVAALEAREDGLLRRLMGEAGELGLLAGAVPAEYGGLGLSRAASALLYERAAGCPSFALAHNVHSGVATLPLVWFGTDEQKRAWLPRLASGETIGAFALTEANAGSDALSARCQAVPREPFGCGGYALTGAKAWITNAGIADRFTVFARIPGVGVTAFLVERDRPGLTLGREEEKLGLRGASTRAVFLDNVTVPESSVLGEPGKGYRVALFPLNIGRLNIGAGALGGCTINLARAAAYARERHQFGRSLSEMGLIRGKLGEMAARTFAAESMIYRVCGLLDRGNADTGNPLTVAEEYAIECALVKIFATEALDFVVDEALQIHGGYGYSEAFPVARAYRDSRVMRIFEGTNEINRLTVIDQIARRLRSGRLSLTEETDAATDPLAGLRAAVRTGLCAFLDAATANGGTDVHQEAAALCADMVLGLFAAESVALRVPRTIGPQCEFARDCATILMAHAARQITDGAAELSAYLGDRALRNQIRATLPEPDADLITVRRRLSNTLLGDSA